MDDYSEQKVSDVWYWMNSNFQADAKSGKWTSRNNVVAVCKKLELEFGISGYRSFEAQSLPTNIALQTKDTFVLTDAFLNSVKALLPPQPWKPGIHKQISAKLGCDTSEYFAAVNALIEEGVFYHQRDGILYDQEGNVVSFDPERVDPQTMNLRPIQN
jgi:hypothetical protein